MVKIWVDDVRPCPDKSWVVVKSVNAAKDLISRIETRFGGFAFNPLHGIAKISLDHDLGEFAIDGGDGIKLMDWLVERGTLYPIEFHTMNPVGRENMERMRRRYWYQESL